ncbi:MAG: GGDEF domain-containing protein [Candidatus Tectomicrobia bacterium]|uniref:diguanylate cyclase n=1 Tax=Tectimicrobiota bacterium TaxID=2528274 RepID=A0A932GQ89_UNCTE|nr:GGDEF domain-containing protein [Candidatus Tectomicrobia bacterium]
MRKPEYQRRNVDGFRREVLRIYQEVRLPANLLAAAKKGIEKGIDGSNFHLEEFPPAKARKVLDRLEEALRQANGPADLLEELDRMESLSITDGLTGIFNYRYFQIRLRGEILRTRRSLEPFSLLLLDIDYFKRINDTYGHLIGDQFLRELSQLIQANSREIDQVFRYGGEEFAIILPRTRTREAFVLAERLRRKVASQVFTAEGIGVSLTISVGINTYQGEPEVNQNDLVHRADQALYQAKTRGRNMIYSEPEIDTSQARQTAVTLDERKDLLGKE